MIVFCVRYMDLFFYFISLYNTLMKLFFISSTATIIYLMRFRKPFSSTYDAIGDGFPHLLYLLPAATLLTIIIHAGDTTWEFVWSWTLWLESLAFIPQIVMLNKIRVVENLTSHYIGCLGMYRFFYILNW